MQHFARKHTPPFAQPLYTNIKIQFATILAEARAHSVTQSVSSKNRTLHTQRHTIYPRIINAIVFSALSAYKSSSSLARCHVIGVNHQCRWNKALVAAARYNTYTNYVSAAAERTHMCILHARARDFHNRRAREGVQERMLVTRAVIVRARADDCRSINSRGAIFVGSAEVGRLIRRVRCRERGESTPTFPLFVRSCRREKEREM